MKRTTFALAAASMALAAVSYAQPPYTMNQLWKVDVGGSLAWFLNDNNTRGLAYYPQSDTLIVPDRGTPNAIYRLDPATGAEKSPNMLNITGVSGGTFLFNLIQPLPDGKLILINLAAATSIFKIYTYASETAAPVNSYSESNVPARYGDSIDVRGSGSNIEVLVGGSGNPNVAIFTSTDGGNTFTKQDVTLDVALVGIPYVKWDPQVTNAFFVRKSAASGTENTALRRYTVSGANATLDTTFGSKITSPAALGPFAVAVTPGNNLIVATTYGNPVANATDLKGLVHHVPTETLLAQTASGLEKAGGANPNINGSGAVDIDLTNKRVFFLFTNNSISAWQLPNAVASGVADWNLY
ncbi:MAG: hypothetical protein N2Z21_10125 [Candidatus Sumerlaeaceae bacterium]|nr:hypothetical protein [Candidatus Sumerlaeaceae bacterium]